MDTAELPPQNPLEELLVAAASAPADAELGRAFVAALLESDLGIPGQEDELGRFAPMIRRYDERSLAVAFTHPARLQRFLDGAGPAPRPIAVHGAPCRAFFGELVRNNVGLLLNAGNGYGKEFTVPEMSDLLAGVTPGTRERVVREEAQIQVGAPAHVPDGLLDRLRGHIGAVGGVTEAALAWVRYPDGLEGYLLEVSGPVDRPTFLAGVDAVVGDLGGRTLDIVVGGAGPRTYTSSVAPFFGG